MTADEIVSGGVELSHWGVIRAEGSDAAAFLHKQLTNDIESLPHSTARLAGFCSAKGRLQATFIVWRSGPEEILLALSRDLLPQTLKRLSMFVLRARCKLSDATDQVPLLGWVGRAAQERVGAAAVWSRVGDEGEESVIRLPDAAGFRRCLSAGKRLPQDAALGSLTLEHWKWLEVESGVPSVEAATFEHFVPQMLNLELIGGVDFAKGCYPGQEVVARTQYRGAVKRRTFLFGCDTPMAAGQEVFHSDDPGQPAGTVVNAAPAPGGGFCALVEVKLTALQSGSLHLGDAGGPVLRRHELPYAIT